LIAQKIGNRKEQVQKLLKKEQVQKLLKQLKESLSTRKSNPKQILTHHSQK
jgi:hypothetical protein